MDELKDRIREAMEGAGLKPLQLAKATKKSSGAVTQWLDGTTKSLKAETASAMEKATGYRADYIVTGKGYKLVVEAKTIQSNQPATAQSQSINDEYALSKEALALARWFDSLPEGLPKKKAYAECFAAVAKRFDEVEQISLRVQFETEGKSGEESRDPPEIRKTPRIAGTDQAAQ